jgi:hypothetical protein
MLATNELAPIRSVVEPKQERKLNFMLWTCSHCNKEISLRSGDVLCGDGWYHAECWADRVAKSKSAKTE